MDGENLNVNFDFGKVYLIEDFYLEKSHSDILPKFNDMLIGGNMIDYNDVGLEYSIHRLNFED